MATWSISVSSGCRRRSLGRRPSTSSTSSFSCGFLRVTPMAASVAQAPWRRNRVILSSPTLLAELGVVDAEALLGGQAEHADLALVQVLVDLVGGLAGLLERVNAGEHRLDLALADQLVGLPRLLVVGEVRAD